MKKPVRILVKILKGIGWFVAGLVGLLILVIILIRFPAVQNKITQKAISFLENKIGTPVALDHIYIGFPKTVVLKGLKVEDQTADTLLYLGELRIDTDLWALTDNKIELNKITLQHIVANVERKANDSTFNFDYIIQAFAGEGSKDTTATAWGFSLVKIELGEIRATYTDQYLGTAASINLGETTLSMAGSDITNNIYKLSDVELANTTAKLTLSPAQKPTAPESESDSTSNALSLAFDQVHLTDVDFDFEDQTNNTNMTSRIGDLLVQANEIDLNNSKIDLKKIALSKSFIAYHTREDKTIEENQTVPTNTNFGFLWNIQVDELALSDNGVQFENFTAPALTKGFDPNHFWVFSLGADINSIVVKEDTYQALVKGFSFKEKKGFSLQNFHTAFAFNPSTIHLSDFLLQTDNSLIALDAEADFNKIAPTDTTVNADITASYLSVKDIEYFLPTLLDSLPVVFPSTTKLYVDSKLRGSLKKLAVERLVAKTLDSTSVELSGTVSNLLDPNALHLDVKLSRLYSTANDIKRIVPDTLLPKSIRLPYWVELNGSMNGLPKKSKLEMQLATDRGSIAANGSYNLIDITQYDFQFAVKEFQLGYLLNQEDVGILEMEAGVTGTGTSFEDLDAKIDATINTIEYNMYSYQDLKIQGTMKDYFFSGEASLQDENIDFEIDADLDYTDSIPKYTINLALNSIDLNALYLAQRPLRAKATLEVNLATSDFKSMNGDLGIRDVAVYNGQSLYKIDSLIFVSLDEEGKSELSIASDIVEGKFEGTFHLVDLPKTIKQHIQQYFALQDSTIKEFTRPQRFKFDLTLKNTEMLTKILVPDLKSFIPGKITGEFDSEKSILDLHIDIAKTQYASFGIEAFDLDVESDPNALQYKIMVKEIFVDTLRIDQINWVGKLANNLLETELLILDSLEKEKFVFAMEANSLPEGFKVHVLPDRLFLNYENWSIPDDNSILFGDDSFQANNFKLVRNQEQFTIASNTEQSTLQFIFKNFQLSTFTNLLAGVIPASGSLNGDVRIANSQAGQFSSNLTIKDFSLFEMKWGDLMLTQQFAEQTHAITVKVNSAKSNLRIKGDLKTAPSLQYDFRADLSPLDLSILEPIVSTQVRDLSGLAKGRLQIKNNNGYPSLVGNLSLSNTNFLAVYLNNKFQIQNETISFTEKGIELGNFVIRDEKKNEASIKGDILTRNYSDFEFDLQLAADNFRLLNTTIEDNDLFYGVVSADIKAKIGGTNKEPKIDMTASVKNESEFTYVIPESTKHVAERKGIIKFVDRDAQMDPFLAGISNTDTVKTSFTGLNLTVNLDLDDNALLNIVLDPRTSDMLSVYGNASLVVDMDPSGRIDLSGRYQITKGSYNFSFQNLAKRKFDIERGSSLAWSGDPLNAEANIRAKYEVAASPLDLIANQTNTTDQSELNSYKQRLPFLVYMNMKGRILEPDISFELDMPEDKRSAFSGAIYAKLQDINTRESDLNKQVFALLILKRFISDNPFESQAASTFSNTARQSVSRLLSDQLNRLSENIKGVELTFDIKSYENYSGEEVQGETKAQLGISKDLFNERLIVKLSGNVNIEGEDNTQTEVTDYIGDIALEYKLTPDGRFRITGFRTSDFDMIDGELTETGAGLIYIKDYNTLRELFKSNKKK